MESVQLELQASVAEAKKMKALLIEQIGPAAFVQTLAELKIKVEQAAQRYKLATMMAAEISIDWIDQNPDVGDSAEHREMAKFMIVLAALDLENIQLDDL